MQGMGTLFRFEYVFVKTTTTHTGTNKQQRTKERISNRRQCEETNYHAEN